ncbi:MAG: glyoxalase [Acidimicrobiaceae bacterium]|nr:glyoxalase [Acidimicrobiaceae bacterium]
MPRLRPTTTTLSTRDARALATFYECLLGWERGSDEPGWVTIGDPAGGHRLGFHHDDHYRPPVWPSRPDEPTMNAHLEIAVDDLDGAVEHAVACGAVPAEVQPQPDVRVMLDPDGHPFCLFLWADMPNDF